MENNELLNENKKTYKYFNNDIFEKLRNFLGMIISFYENNYQIQIKPSDLLIKYEKKNTYYDKNNYFIIFNISLNKNNIKLSENFIKESQNVKKSFERLIFDKENFFDLDLTNRLFEKQIFDYKEFIFQKEINNELINYKIPDNKNNILIYVLRNNNDNNIINNNLDFIIKNNGSFFYFEKVYVIKCYNQHYNKNNDQFVLNNDSNNLIEYLIFHSNNCYNVLFNNTNIFDLKSSNNYNYFFICNNEKRISKIYNKICPNENFILKLKHFFNKNKEKDLKGLEELNCLLNKLISKKYLKYYTDFKFSMESFYKFDDSLYYLNLYKIKNLSIKGSLRTIDYNLLNNVINNLNLKSNKINFDLKEIETFNLLDIDFNKEILCKNCNNLINTKCNDKNNELNPKGFYYCYWCKDFYCIKCVEEKLSLNCTTNFQQKLIDKKHNLLYFCTTDKEDLKEFDKLKLGLNHYNENNLNSLTLYNEKHDFICNGCESNSRNLKIKARYVCVSCRPGIYRDGGYVDYCFNCIEHLRNEDDIGKEIEEIEDEYCPKKHNHRHHVYFCVVFQIESYQNY